MDLIQIAQQHQPAIWAAFLLPMFIVFLRGAQLENRQDRYGKAYMHHPMIYLVAIPGLSLIPAVLCSARSIYEIVNNTENPNATW